MAIGSAALVQGDFTNVGHAVALVLGMAAGTRFGHPARWTPARYALLAVAVSFGYMIMANTPLSLVVTSTMGVTGALVAHGVARWRTLRRTLEATAVPQYPSRAV